MSPGSFRSSAPVSMPPTCRVLACHSQQSADNCRRPPTRIGVLVSADRILPWSSAYGMT